MKVLRFKNSQPEWCVPLAELAPAIKCALFEQWRQFIHQLEDVEDTDKECAKTDLSVIFMFERSYKKAS